MKSKVLQLLVYTILCSTIGILNCSAQAPNWLWAEKAGGISSDFGKCITSDGNGNVYMTGKFASPTISFGSYTLINNSLNNDDIFIVKYDASGNVQWARSAGGNYEECGSGISVDADGNIYVTGYFSSLSINFDSFTLTNPGLRYCVFVVKYDASGNVLWANSAGEGTGYDEGKSIATDDFGNIYLTGWFQSPTITFGSCTLTNVASGYDIFVVKYRSTGDVLWAKSAGGSSTVGANYDLSNEITVDDNGNSFVTGTFNSPTITFGSYVLTNASGFDIFVVKYDASGNALWAKNSEGTGGDEGKSIKADASGNCYITGCFYSPTITFGSYTLTNNSNSYYDIFVVKYDALGNVLWAKRTGGTYSDQATSITLDANNNSYITGFFYSMTFTFGSCILTKTDADEDIFVLKYDASGNEVWAKSVGGEEPEEGYSITADASGNCYVTGYFISGTIIFGNDTLTSAGGYNIFVAKLGTDSTSSTSELNEQLIKVTIFPNPARDELTVEGFQKTEIEILNIHGQLIKSTTATKEYTTIDISDLSDGIYFIKVNTDKGIAVKKFIKN